MAEVNYKASGSRAGQQNDEPSVEILDPKVNSFSVSFSDELETSIRDKSLDLDHPNRPSSESFISLYLFHSKKSIKSKK